jgi:hypothetical protein
VRGGLLGVTGSDIDFHKAEYRKAEGPKITIFDPKIV